MKNILIGMLVLVGLVDATNYSLFTDKRGRKSGDIVTVLVVENASASDDTHTSTNSQNSMSVGVQQKSGLLKWIPGFGFSGGANVGFNGQGGTARTGALKATVTARIVQVMENGNLTIEGSKLVTINNEEEVLEVSGMVRADDINPDNSIPSSKLADAVIRYTGNGVDNSAQEPGVISRFFNWLF